MPTYEHKGQTEQTVAGSVRDQELRAKGRKPVDEPQPAKAQDDKQGD